MNTNKRNTTLEKLIDAFVKGNLTTKDKERMWLLLLEHPEYLERLKTEATLAVLFGEKHSASTSSESTERSSHDGPIRSLFRRFPIA